MIFAKFLLFLFILLLFSIRAPAVAAQDKPPSLEARGNTMPISIMPPIPPDTNPILGQEHAYSVLFRGNGDAVVIFRAAFTNENTNKTNTLSFRIPRATPRRINAFQILREPQCLRYDATCVQYQEPNYFQWYAWTAKYQRASTGFSGDTLTITLPQPVKPTKSGSVLLILNASGYTKKNILGAYTYAFETFTVESANISKSTIGVSVDNDLVLAGTKGNINYRFSETDALGMPAFAAKAAVENPQLDQIYSQAGYGMITKNVSHLEPLESYTVRGRYADSSVRLWAKHLMIGLGMSVVFIISLALLGKKLAGKRIGKHWDIAIMIGASFTTAALVAVYTASLFILRTWIRQMVSYDVIGIVLILITIISIGVYGLLLTIHAILLGISRGLAWGLGTFGLTVLFLVVNAVIMIVVLAVLGGNDSPSIIQPMYSVMKEKAPREEMMVQSSDAAFSPQ